MEAGRVLIVGTDEWAIDQAAASLTAAGREVLRCHEPGAAPFPCNAFRPDGMCPVDAGFDVVVTVRARPSRQVEPGEVGVVCALRANRPLVVAGVGGAGPFESVAAARVPDRGDVVSTSEAVVSARRERLQRGDAARQHEQVPQQ